jgi:hypothetical protein
VNRRRFFGLLGMASTAYFFAPKGGWYRPEPLSYPNTCPPRCPDHLHLWQVEEAMKRQEAYMRGLIAEPELVNLCVVRQIEQAKAEYDAQGCIGGLVGYYQVDGGSYFQGHATRQYHKKLSDGREIHAHPDGRLWVNKFPGSFEVVRA